MGTFESNAARVLWSPGFERLQDSRKNINVSCAQLIWNMADYFKTFPARLPATPGEDPTRAVDLMIGVRMKMCSGVALTLIEMAS